MPIVMTAAEELAWTIGEQIQADVKTWAPAHRDYDVAPKPEEPAFLLITTKDGKDYLLTLQEVEI